MFEGVSSRTVFCIWTGLNPMSIDRVQGLFSIFQNTHCPVAFLNAKSIRKWELPESPFHPAYEFLSETHKSDYLRVYLMHHYGGGYTDIKHTQKSWDKSFDQLAVSDKWCLGYTEISPNGVANVEEPLFSILKENYKSLIGLCSFIFKKRTLLTETWLTRTNALLDEKYELLQRNPARHPQDWNGFIFPDGTASSYPLKWTELLGNIFHPLIFEHKDMALHGDIVPLLQLKYR